MSDPTSEDVIRRYLKEHVSSSRAEIVSAVDNHFGEGWLSHKYIHTVIDEIVADEIIEKDAMFFQDGRYYKRKWC